MSCAGAQIAAEGLFDDNAAKAAVLDVLPGRGEARGDLRVKFGFDSEVVETITAGFAFVLLQPFAKSADAVRLGRVAGNVVQATGKSTPPPNPILGLVSDRLPHQRFHLLAELLRSVRRPGHADNLALIGQ